MQFQLDQERPAYQRQWLRCNISEDGQDVLIVLAKQGMIKCAVRRGMDEPFILDATHGLQRYGPNYKLVTGHIVDEEQSGMW
jgi:glutathionylspermidine synthase